MKNRIPFKMSLDDPKLITDGIANTINTRGDLGLTHFGAKTTGLIEREGRDSMRVRKLTPKECFRLMGFSDKDFDKARKVNSDRQLYKQAGNSIVVPVLEQIFKQMT